jgi:hypothetical protein
MNELTALYDADDTVQCSEAKEHCFLCSSVDPDGVDGAAAGIRSFVAELTKQKKELPFIVNSVYDVYVHQKLGSEWSKASIRRHLLFSVEFAELFANVVDQLFVSLIMRTQKRMVDEVGGIDESARKALLDSIGAFSAWKKRRI